MARINRLAQAALLSLALAALAPARASLVGDSVLCAAASETPPALVCSPSSAVVGAAVEFTLGDTSPILAIDVGAASIVLTTVRADGLIFLPGDKVSLGSLDDASDASVVLTGIALSLSAGVSGLTLGDITFTDHALTLSLDDATFLEGSTVTLQLSFSRVTPPPEPPDGGNGAPEPAAAWLLALGLAGLAGARRLRRA